MCLYFYIFINDSFYGCVCATPTFQHELVLIRSTRTAIVVAIVTITVVVVAVVIIE
jgi:hypothetical protein